MKSSAFADRLEEAAAVFAAAHATNVAATLRAIVPIFRALPTKTVIDIIKKLENEDYAGASFMQTRLDTVAGVLPALERFTASVASKAVATDFSAFSALIEKHKNAGLDQFIKSAMEALALPAASKSKAAKAPKALRIDLVEHYHKKLEEALGDDPGFRQLIAKLQHDHEMTSAEMTALAKRFAFASPKGRDQALKKITSRHQDLMISRAASRATAGRIAG